MILQLQSMVEYKTIVEHGNNRDHRDIAIAIAISLNI